MLDAGRTEDTTETLEMDWSHFPQASRQHYVKDTQNQRIFIFLKKETLSKLNVHHISKRKKTSF